MSDHLLKTEKLSASYGDADVIREISFAMAPGEIVCIVGESGSGKSTLIKAVHGMSGLIVTGGSIFFGGRDITNLPLKERRKLMGSAIGLIPQDPAASFNPIRKLDVQFREAMAGHGLDYDEGRIDDVLKKIGLTQGAAVLKSRPFELSGGMNQRIAIASAMLFKPELLLCECFQNMPRDPVPDLHQFLKIFRMAEAVAVAVQKVAEPELFLQFIEISADVREELLRGHVFSDRIDPMPGLRRTHQLPVP